jgi:hypothetical protein
MVLTLSISSARHDATATVPWIHSRAASGAPSTSVSWQLCTDDSPIPQWTSSSDGTVLRSGCGRGHDAAGHRDHGGLSLSSQDGRCPDVSTGTMHGDNGAPLAAFVGFRLGDTPHSIEKRDCCLSWSRARNDEFALSSTRSAGWRRDGDRGRILRCCFDRGGRLGGRRRNHCLSHGRICPDKARAREVAIPGANRADVVLAYGLRLFRIGETQVPLAFPQSAEKRA